ncbi:hypothetical protein BCR44DRAFT_1443053, partial [Catenaria anguillulae PL171]
LRLLHSVSTRFISFAIGVTGRSLMCLLTEREPGVTHPRAMRKLVALLAVNAGSLLGVIVAVRIVNWKVRTYPVYQYEASLRDEDESRGTLGERSQPWMRVSVWDAPSPGMVIGAMVLNAAIGYVVTI